MHLPRFFFDADLKIGNRISLDENLSKRIIKVLRLKKDCSLILFHGRGGEFVCTIVATHKHSVEVSVDTFQSVNRESLPDIHVGLGISRALISHCKIQKAVECGVHSITPLFTEFCNVKLTNERAQARLHHWHNVVVSAVEQCGRTRVPKIYLPQPFLEWIKKDHSVLKIICDTETKQNLSKECANYNNSPVYLLIGPEGGFSPEEKQRAKQENFFSLSLGPRILRTETAPVVAITLLQHCLKHL